MKWTTIDLDTYLQASEYVDTAIIPLIPVTWSQELKTTVSMGEFIHILSNELERQFKGRVVLFPSFTYLRSERHEDRIRRLDDWMNELLANGFKHVIFLTSDYEWREVESDVQQPLIWVPSLSLEHVEDKYKQTMIQEQMKQIIPIMMKKWS